MASLNNSVIDENIPDSEIRRRLIEDYNIQCGPVTPQTKRIMLKKLMKLEQEKSMNASMVNNNAQESSNGTMSGDSHDNEQHSFTNGNGYEFNDDIVIEDIPEINTTENISTTPPAPIIRILPEVDTPRRSSPITRRTRQSTTNEQQSQSSTKHYRDKILEEFDARKAFKEIEAKMKPSPNPLNPLNWKASITSPRVSTGDTAFRSPMSRAPIRRTKAIFETKKSLLNYSDSESSDSESPTKDRIHQLLLSHRPGLGLNRANQKRSLTSRFTSFFRNLFKRSPKNESADFSTSSNYISLGLLIFVIIFFTVIFSIYFYSKLTYNSRHTVDLNDFTFIEDKSKLISPICEKNTDNGLDQLECLPFETDRKPALNIVKEIKNLIDRRIYEAFCGTTSSTIPDIESFVFKKIDLVKEIESNIQNDVPRDPSLGNKSPKQLLEYDLTNAFKLIKLNTAWNMMVEQTFMSEISLTPNYTIQLPIQCRLKLFWNQNFWLMITTMTTILAGIVFFSYYRYSKHRELQEQEMVYDLIDKAMELLQSPDEPQSMPVLHIRDTLLSPAEKKSAKYKRIWNKVVNHIENNESRVKVEFKDIDGEEFKAWKWIAHNQFISDSENDTDSTSGTSQTQKIGGVEWQGQAFGSLNNDTMESSYLPELNRNKSFQALTRFLKIRNIFEKEAQYIDSNWSQKIKNTILAKTAARSENGQHDIVHIEIDDSTNEGLVFLKCGSMAGATNAFHALHGWWCEKKLVSVKFLKEDRYYQRFPMARDMVTPLNITPVD